jgi:DNA-directed RNA polymerase III subunit RPC6
MENFLEFIEGHENGVSEEDIVERYPSTTKEEIAKNLNILLKNRRIDIYNDGSTLRYRKSDPHKDDGEKIIYQLLKESGGKGLWLRDIRNKTNIPQSLVSKLLRTMESKKIIKSIKSIKSNRKVYILYDGKPSDELTGGVWFNEADVDNEFVEELTKVVYTYLCREYTPKNRHSLLEYESYPDISTIHKFISNSGVCSVQVTECDVLTLLKVMVYDGKLQELKSDRGVLYRPIAPPGLRDT